MKENPDKIMCFEIVENCVTKSTFIVVKLNNNIYSRVYKKNSYNLMISYLRGLNEFLLNAIESKILPIILPYQEQIMNLGQSPSQPIQQKEGETNITQNQVGNLKLSWLEQAGYFVDKKTGHLFVFSGKVNLFENLDEEDKMDEVSTGEVIKSLFNYIKEIFH